MLKVRNIGLCREFCRYLNVPPVLLISNLKLDGLSPESVPVILMPDNLLLCVFIGYGTVSKRKISLNHVEILQ